jgi:hypothetical protein
MDYRANFSTDENIHHPDVVRYDNLAREVIEEYMEQYPEHDLIDYEFALGGISCFLHTCDHYNYRPPQDICDRYIRMRMKLIPLDFDFIFSVKATIERGGRNLN